MAYPSDVGIVNGGWMDAWNTAREPGFGMAYFDRTDLPFYYAMADSWSIGDQYFQSSQTATNPNRQFLFSGRNCDGNITPPLNATQPTFCHLDDDESEGLTWETMAETLQAAGVSWRVLQENDNFDDNAFEWFQSFIDAKPGSALFDNGVKPVADIVVAFNDMVANDALPQVCKRFQVLFLYSLRLRAFAGHVDHRAGRPERTRQQSPRRRRGPHGAPREGPGQQPFRVLKNGLHSQLRRRGSVL
jgi:phospholipase C